MYSKWKSAWSNCWIDLKTRMQKSLKSWSIAKVSHLMLSPTTRSWKINLKEWAKKFRERNKKIEWWLLIGWSKPSWLISILIYTRSLNNRNLGSMRPGHSILTSKQFKACQNWRNSVMIYTRRHAILNSRISIISVSLWQKSNWWTKTFWKIRGHNESMIS